VEAGIIDDVAAQAANQGFDVDIRYRLDEQVR